MNFIEAIKRGKPILRKGESFVYGPIDTDTIGYFTISREDLLSTDWEVEEKPKEITFTQFWEAVQEAYRKSDSDRGINWSRSKVIDVLAQELGFKDKEES